MGLLFVGFKQNFLMRTLFLLFICLFWSKTTLAETLQTRNFVVKITRNCPEGEVVCNNVSYTGTSLRTAESIEQSKSVKAGAKNPSGKKQKPKS